MIRNFGSNVDFVSRRKLAYRSARARALAHTRFRKTLECRRVTTANDAFSRNFRMWYRREVDCGMPEDLLGGRTGRIQQPHAIRVLFDSPRPELYPELSQASRRENLARIRGWTKVGCLRGLFSRRIGRLSRFVRRVNDVLQRCVSVRRIGRGGSSFSRKATLYVPAAGLSR